MQLKKPRNFYWLINGILAGSNRPSEAEIRWMYAQGIRAIISLTVKRLSSHLLSELNLEYLHSPITDFTAPTLETLKNVTDFIEEMRNRNKPVVVHCGEGKGRTGTILAAYLIKKGYTAEEAIKEIRKKSPRSIETEEQETILKEFEKEDKFK